MGIGAAGGKSSASEGALLAARLDTLRKERSERAPEIKKKEVVSTSSSSFNPGQGGRLPSAVPPRKPSRRNKRKNKR